MFFFFVAVGGAGGVGVYERQANYLQLLFFADRPGWRDCGHGNRGRGYVRAVGATVAAGHLLGNVDV